MRKRVGKSRVEGKKVRSILHFFTDLEALRRLAPLLTLAFLSRLCAALSCSL